MKRLFLLMLVGLFAAACSEQTDVAGIYLCHKVTADAAVRSDAEDVFLGHTFRVYTMPDDGGIGVLLDTEPDIMIFEPDGRSKYRSTDYIPRGNEVVHTIKFSGDRMTYKFDHIVNGRTLTVEVQAVKQRPIVE